MELGLTALAIAASLGLASPFAVERSAHQAVGSGAPPESLTPDSDRDGLSDELERRSGTDPLNADTDEDGVRDGVEDADRDGMLDRGESNPRAPGLYPGLAPHIPEPLGFDLVRGLGARKGEVETNALFVLHTRKGASSLDWAPEFEWAFAHRHAVEFEVGLQDLSVDSIKLAFQGTAEPRSGGGATHGWQAISAVSPLRGTWTLTQLYIGAAKAGRFSTLWMFGVRYDVLAREGLLPEAIVNQSWMWDLAERVTTGVELNVVVPMVVPMVAPMVAPTVGPVAAPAAALASAQLRLLPQLHVQLGKRVRVQFGSGVDLYADGVAAIQGLRLILE